MITQAEILSRLRRGELTFAPVELKVERVDRSKRSFCADAAISARWEGQISRFVAEVKAIATPKALREAIAQARQSAAQTPGALPLVVVPYLSPESLAELEAQSVSGLDLCGNGILISPGKLLIVRSGRPNRFPGSEPIRNIYRGDTSIVARALLLQPQYTAVKQIVEMISQREGTITFSTVSKALKRLEEDLVVTRGADGIQLAQPDKLLERLAASYVAPRITGRFLGKSRLPTSTILKTLIKCSEMADARLVMTGEASAERYAVMAREPIVSLYCSEPPEFLLREAQSGVEATTRFPNLELLQTDDNRVYFDCRRESRVPYSSPLQTWLELATGEKRQREAADQVRNLILEAARQRRSGHAGRAA